MVGVCQALRRDGPTSLVLFSRRLSHWVTNDSMESHHCWRRPNADSRLNDEPELDGMMPMSSGGELWRGGRGRWWRQSGRRGLAEAGQIADRT